MENINQWKMTKMKTELTDLIHIKIHALRMLGKNYKPTQFELDINKLICAEYANACMECREKYEVLKNISPKTQEKKSFMENLLGG